ncbi:MAG: thioredoxin family protein [Cellvibrionaceae bacterium]
MNKNSQLTTFLVIGIGLFLNACDKNSKDPTHDINTKSLNEYQHTPEKEIELKKTQKIHWYKGSIEQAFIDAQELKKPLFLYWGAIWCPPCEEIKQTVFKSQHFIAQSELFIPVYLDGDTDRAQLWGEKFSVKGYPTMIVFNPAGEEVTRIPGAIDIDKYNTVLALSLNGLKKTSSLIEKALITPDKLTSGDYTQLAFYAWDQNNLGITSTAELLDKLADAAELKRNALASSRLFLQSLIQRIDDKHIMSEENASIAYEKLKGILNDSSLLIANLDFSMFMSEKITKLLTKPGAKRVELEILWTKSMESIRFDDSLSKAQRLGTWYPQLHLYWLNNPNATELPEAIKSQVIEHVNQMDISTSGSARQTVMNKGYQVLQAAHLNDLSRTLLKNEIGKSDSPYYFMSGLASLEEKENNIDTAVGWLLRAYEASSGKATKFQWGVEYVTGLMRMKPNETEKISAITKQLINDLDRPIDILSGRNFKRLSTLLDAGKNWEMTTRRTKALKEFYKTINSLCNSAIPNSQAATNCNKISV